MISKIAENHFNTLRMTSSIAIQSGEGNRATVSAKHDVFETFMLTPSFSNKQIAIESLIRQITQGNTSHIGKTGTTG